MLEDGVPVLGFDYTEQWERLLEKNTNQEMLDRYAEFGMRRSPKDFKGKVVDSIGQLDDLLASASVTIVDLSETYDSAERVDGAGRMLDHLLEYF